MAFGSVTSARLFCKKQEIQLSERTCMPLNCGFLVKIEATFEEIYLDYFEVTFTIFVAHLFVL